MDTTTSAPADTEAQTFMEGLHQHPEYVETLEQQGIVIKSRDGTGTINADCWKASAEEARRTLEDMSRALHVRVTFALQERMAGMVAAA